MRISGAKRLMRQLNSLHGKVHAGVQTSVEKTVKAGVTKAKAISPVRTGDFKRGINGDVVLKENNDIFGFINFYDADPMTEHGFQEALAAATINYGWNNMPVAFNVRAQVKSIVGKRHKRAVSRQIKKAIKEALNG